MNVRNLVLAAIIFCVAPIVSATPSATMTKQEQEIVKEWAKTIKNHLTTPQRATIKAAMFLMRDYFLFALDKIMVVGRDRAECAKEIYVIFKAYIVVMKHRLQVLENSVEEISEQAGPCPLEAIQFKMNIDKNSSDYVVTKTVDLSLGADDLVLRFKEVTTEDGEKVIEKKDEAVITEQDIVKMKKILACYSFMAKSL